MAVSHKGAISFGLVHIPVALYTATQDNDIHFNQLCRDDHSRIRYKKVCASCGKEVSAKDIVKGFEYDDGRYVIISDDDFEKMKTEKDKSISIIHFTDMQSIRPIFYDKTYHAVPEKGGEKAYELLRRSMIEENKVAIARTVLGTKETMLAIIPTPEGLLVETMFFAEEIKNAPKALAQLEVNEQELTLAKTLINSMVKDFEPQQYHDEYQERLRKLIEMKIAGQEVVASKEDEPTNVISLMEALQQSIKEGTEKDPSPKKRTRRKKGA